MKKRFLTIGCANIDLIQQLSCIPTAGQTVFSPYSYSYTPGGKGANSAVCFARLGVDSIFCTSLGDDSNGKRLKTIYESENIDTRFVRLVKKEQTGFASILVEENGDNRIIVYPGAGQSFSEEQIEEAFTTYPDAVYIQFETPDDIIKAAARRCKKDNIPLFIDAGPAKTEFDLSELGHVTVFSPNQNECIEYTGIDPSNTEKCLAAAIKLGSQIDAEHIVIKLGDKGCFIYDGKFHYMIPAINVAVADTTAAGDVFTAALAMSYMDCQNIMTAVKFASCAAALCVSKEGSFPSIPTLKEISDFAVAQNKQIF